MVKELKFNGLSLLRKTTTTIITITITTIIIITITIILSKNTITDNNNNQNYNKILEHDWLSAARFEHELDSVRVMLVIGQYVSFCVHCCGALCCVNCWVFRHS